jgi:apolipoprotein N-acyltransferase
MTWLAEIVMLSHGWRRVLILFVAGAIGALSVPPFYILPALFVAMPVWVWALDGAERFAGIRRIFGPAFTVGFFFGLGYFCVALHWLGSAFFAEGGFYPILAPFAVLALAALLALFWGLASALAHLFWSGGALRIVTLATFLSLAEWARGTQFSGFPFDLIGYALTANDEMAQLASVVGVYGLTFLAALLAMTPSLIWPPDQRGLTRRLVPFFASLVVIAAQVGYGNYRLQSTAVTERNDVRMRLVQPAIHEHTDWAAANPADIVAKLTGLSEQQTSADDPGLASITHLVWPESVFPFFLSDYPPALAQFGRMLPDDVLLLTGAPRENWNDEDLPQTADQPAYNSLLAINTDGEVVATYDKAHLVPFGEYLPFASFWRMLGINQFVPGTNGWAPGDGKRLMTPPNSPAFIALICYEAIFSGDLGANPADAAFILNITNDAWFDGSIGPAQHAHHAKIRAVETGLPLIRVGNTGITMLTDPLGRVTAQLAPGGVGTLDVVPALKLPDTIFNRIGMWPFWIAILAGLAIAFVSRRRAKRRA